jgi:hypothetical protein
MMARENAETRLSGPTQHATIYSLVAGYLRGKNYGAKSSVQSYSWRLKCYLRVGGVVSARDELAKFFNADKLCDYY